jgi:uncharacterized membrane protein
MGRSHEVLCRTALLGLIGFLAAGMFDHTYAHSLALMLLCSVVLMPIIPLSSGTYRAPKECAGRAT